VKLIDYRGGVGVYVGDTDAVAAAQARSWTGSESGGFDEIVCKYDDEANAALRMRTLMHRPIETH